MPAATVQAQCLLLLLSSSCLLTSSCPEAESDEDYDKVEAEFENETDDEGREESGEVPLSEVAFPP